MGTAELRRRDRQATVVSPDERRLSAARSMRVDVTKVRPVGATSQLDVFAATVSEPRLFGWLSREVTLVRVVDHTGIVRLQRRDALVREASAAHLESALRGVLSTLSAYGDAGREIPDVYLLVGARIISLAGLSDDGQVIGLATTEVRGTSDHEPVVLIATRRAG